MSAGIDISPDAMTQPVFISYARDASREHAEALHKALGGRTAFLDTEAIPIGDEFPKVLVDALFGARVVVIFAEPRYFTRWYCLLEFRIARTPFLRAAEKKDAAANDALRGLVVAMPPRDVDPMMERFPPLVRGRNWPDVTDIERIAELVEAELAANPPTLRERYASVADADAARSFLLEATRLPPPLRIGNVPFVPQIGLPPTIANDFVGRADDLWRIHDLLWTERGDPATAAGLTGAIEATGGFGKTRLALEYLYRYGRKYFRGGLFWINAESDAELQLYDVLQALNPSTPAIEHVRQGSGGVPGAVARAIRSRPDDAPPPLFIIDNVPEPEPDQRPRPLETWCPILGEVPVLTTSRTRVALAAGGSVVALPIETLTPDAAVDLLATEMPRAALEDAEWKEIAEWVGHLPLALEVLNRLLRSGEMSPRAVLDLSRNRTPSAAIDEAKRSIEHVVPEGALRGITEAFSTSYGLLTPEEQYAARLIAWMAPAPIPTFVIDTFGAEVFPPGVRSKLRSRSFVTEVRDSSGAYYFGAMHRVLADFVRTLAGAPENEVDTVVSHLAKLIQIADGRGTPGSALVRECAPLVLSVYNNWIARPIASNDFPKAYGFVNYAGISLAGWGLPTLAGDLFAALASASERRLGGEHSDTLDAMNNLALTQFDRGDLAGAQEIQEHILESRRRILGDEHPDTLKSIFNLCVTLRMRGDYAEAKQLEERAIEVMRRVLGEGHPDTLTATGNWALTLRRDGDHAGAEALQEHVLKVTQRHFGDEHPDTLRAIENLANTRLVRGDYAGAQWLLERVLKINRGIFGDEHPKTLTSMNNLANTLYAQGNYAGAQELQEQTFEAMQRRLGEEHPLTTIAGGVLLKIYVARKDSVAANRLINEKLRWLINRDPASLTEEQRHLQAMLRRRS